MTMLMRLLYAGAFFVEKRRRRDLCAYMDEFLNSKAAICAKTLDLFRLEWYTDSAKPIE